MLANIDPAIQARINAKKQKMADASEYAKRRTAEQNRLNKNLANLGESFFTKLAECSVERVVRGSVVFKRVPSLLWDKFHGDSYVDLYDPESPRTDVAQFQFAVFQALKAMVTDSYNVGDRAELTAWMEVLSEDFGFGLTSAPVVSRGGINGDYSVKRFLQNRYTAQPVTK